MAAKLKKRALAEYQSQVQVEDKTEKTKRLKLVIRKESSDQEPESILSLDSESSGRDVIRNIVGFSCNINNLSAETLSSALKKIIELLTKEKDPCVRVKLVLAWGDILAQDKVEDVSTKVDEMLAVTEDSTKVTGAWLVSLKKIAMKHNLNKNLKQKLFTVGSALLHSTPHPLVHSKSLGLLACLVSPDLAAMSSQVLELCGSYSMSQDARVRTAAFHGLLTIHKRGVKLDVSMYPVFCTALTDDYEGVRCEALKLLSALAETEPEFQVEVEGDVSESNRLVDDVFSRTCQAINDVREQVRGLAAKLIGNMKSVSQVFLEQTLDKKLMSNMRLKKSAHERMNNLISSGDWSSGKKWADDAPKEHLDAEQVNLVALGSCGAFVHGLEDECLSVRVASVDSLTKLAIGNQDLAFIALDFLVDMFNDEIEQVRLKAIESLTAIARHIKLHAHQLEIILGALDDFSTLLREKLHAMLQACTIATKDGLKNVIQKLLANLKRYPQDRRSILVTFKHLGSNHPDLTLPLVTTLLEIHPYFDKQENDIEDPAYLCTLILVLNAAQHCPTLPMLLDSHTRRHHSYLQDTFPHLIPSSTSVAKQVITSQTSEFLNSVLTRVSLAAKMSSSRSLSVLHTSITELTRLANIEPSLGDPSSFARTYIEGQALYLRIVSDPSWAQASLQHGPVIRSNISTLQGIVLKLHSMFSNIGPENQFLIRMLKLKVMAVNLVYVVCGSNKSALSLTEAFMKEFEVISKEISEADIAKEPFLVGVLMSLTIPEAKPGYIARKLKPLLISNPLVGLESVPLDLAMARATIHEPTGGQETPLKYMAGLVLGIPMDCEVHNITNTDLLRICIFTGDQQNHLSIPRRGDLVPLPSGSGYRLLTTALLSHQVWSEPLDVEVSLVLDLSGDRRQEKKTKQDNIVHICKPVKVSVLPKPVRRGL
eukprot:TRINITY_DN11803_c0_g1_i1.p1 TRINITY_DN11803_c0_g1~~TRINITY_DN11803_c0_g1_i1.p1  ORF type:complete len:952 (-),score=245.87 TRINITY_DN11803_c0_g1_i1:99-2909(-)